MSASFLDVSASGLETTSLLCPQKLAQGLVGVGGQGADVNHNSFGAPAGCPAASGTAGDAEEWSDHCSKRVPWRKMESG